MAIWSVAMTPMAWVFLLDWSQSPSCSPILALVVSPLLPFWGHSHLPFPLLLEHRLSLAIQYLLFLSHHSVLLLILLAPIQHSSWSQLFISMCLSPPYISFFLKPIHNREQNLLQKWLQISSDSFTIFSKFFLILQPHHQQHQYFFKFMENKLRVQ